MRLNAVKNIRIIFAIALITAGCSKKETSINEPSETIPNAAYIDVNNTQQVNKIYCT